MASVKAVKAFCESVAVASIMGRRRNECEGVLVASVKAFCDGGVVKGRVSRV